MGLVVDENDCSLQTPICLRQEAVTEAFDTVRWLVHTNQIQVRVVSIGSWPKPLIAQHPTASFIIRALLF